MRIKYFLSIVLATLVLLGCESNKKVTEVIYDQYNGKDGFSTLILPPNFIDNFISEEKKDQQALLKTLRDFRLMFFDNVVDGKSQSDVQDDINSLLTKRNFDDYLTINKDGAQISIKAKSKNDVIQEMHVLIGGKEKLIMASMTGKIDMEQVSRTLDNLDFNDFDEIGEFSGDFDFDDFKFIF